MRSITRNITAVAAVVASLTIVTSASAKSSSQYRIEGRGWGHGIGMSQYGANGFANQGMSGQTIVQHYYAGTVVAPAPPESPASLRVLLQSYLDPAQVQMTSPGVLSQGVAKLELQPGDIVEMRAAGANLTAVRIRSGIRATLAPGSPLDATILPTIDAGAKILFDADHADAGTSFRGTLTGHVYEGKVSVVNTVPFEQYLRGVVPDEMPPSWHPEALKAQAIAARGYALTGLAKDHAWFDMYSDTRSQVYGGRNAEEASTDAAIIATAGQVARVGTPTGPMARTFFFSTSAGRTAANEDVWGSTPYPYLRSATSPYETASPYFVWKGRDVQVLQPAALGAKFAGTWKGRFLDATETLRPSGYVDKVTFRGTAGSATLSGSQVQAKLGLRSSWFRMSLLSITAPNAARVGTYVRYTGKAPRTGITSVTLTVDGVAGKPIRIKVAKNGTWVVLAKVRGTTVARMSRAGVLGPAIVVAPVR